MTKSARHTRRAIALMTAAVSATAILCAPNGAQAAVPPVRPVRTSHFGALVNATTGGNVCTVQSGETCQPGRESTSPGGFFFPDGVAAASGNMYVTELENNRVQELTPAGEFVAMFGEEVNETTKGDICTEEEVEKGAKCKAGVAGSDAGAFDEPGSVVVDPSTDAVYVEDYRNWRVDEFTPAGKFVLMFGKEVNATKVAAVKAKGGTPTSEEVEEEDVCTAASGDACEAGVQNAAGGSEHAAFNFAFFAGNLLAVGSPEDLVYVGDEHRVQEFDAATGAWKGEIPLTSISAGENEKVAALAVDSAGDVYLAYAHFQGSESEADTIREFDPEGQQSAEFTVTPIEANAEIGITGMALDGVGRLAVTAYERGFSTAQTRGLLYEAATGLLRAEFKGPGGAIEFNDNDELLAAATPSTLAETGHEVLAYTLLALAEPVTGSSPSCTVGAEHETSVTFGCTLVGELNPYDVARTTAWFQYGTGGALTSSTVTQNMATGTGLVPVQAGVEGLRPNQAYHYRLVAEDENTGGEPALGATVAFKTPSVPPQVTCNVPEAFFVEFSSAVLSCAVNPENASTTYQFEYGACENLDSCPGELRSEALQSAAYGVLGVAQSAVELAPATTYRYRLVAVNEHNEETSGNEGAFTTTATPSPSAVTASPGEVTATSAMLMGTVQSGGAGATYSFEVGIYNGAGTVYSTIASGPVAAQAVAAGESFTLTGLQPGTTYAYRLALSSAYGTPVGEPVLFTTAGLPTVLFAPSALSLLPVPSIAFPTEAKGAATTKKAIVKCKRGKKLDHGKCVEGKSRKHARKAKKTSRSLKAKR